jgi:hypothetical protein
MTRRSLIPAALAMVLSMAGAAHAKPNFTGDWKLIVDKSDFGPMPPPASATAKVAHAEPEVKMTVKQVGDQGEMEYSSTYSTDGKETSNTFGPMETKSTAAWEGEVLVVNTKLDVNGSEVKLIQKWTLSEDGKTLRQATHVVSPQGEFDMVSVYEKAGN